MTAATAIRVEVWFDLICPWCLIGKRQLERALADFARLQPRTRVELQWRSQALLPDIPTGGLPFEAFYLHRLGSAAAVAARQEQVRQAGRAAGLSFDFGRIPRMPNTLAAHALIADAQEQCEALAVDALIEALFEAHFQRSLDLGDESLLDQLARSHGVVRSAARPAPRHQVRGVPFFVVDQRLALSGAQPAEQLLDLLMQAGAAPVAFA
ncbi:DsbA family oxidoreductase [Roseateles violae]|uniref:DsbA family oxidoreductase n=1 Tax=Roseateles violae TaxID=3058042 RepID=A0ABT8DZD4_9BURK|nr:DsbA family oxidoreductase [Pelomonas sp. PFR6]MDN3922943.1 DsbA family oxidoreductase [Pelomonas sp. PFR6]